MKQPDLLIDFRLCSRRILGATLFAGMALSTSLAALDWKAHTIMTDAPEAINTAVVTDLDQDGHMDVMATYGFKAIVFKGPDWEPHMVHQFVLGRSRTQPRGACMHSCLLDADGDGDLDFIGSDLTVFWLEVPADPFSGEEWTYRTIDDELLGTHCVVAGDVNGDGVEDLIANSWQTEANTPVPYSITWLERPENSHDAKSWVRHIFADRDAPGGNHYMGFGDVNGDGRPDISCGAKGGKGFPGGEWFAWWEQSENGSVPWKKHLLSENEPGATNINPVDVNGDGVMDFIATRGHGKGVLWFEGPRFRKIEIDTEIDKPHSLSIEDFDLDGDLDFAVCGSVTDGVAAWYENDGSGRFEKHVITKNQASYDLRSVDMDGDGDMDLLNAGHFSKNIVWFENLLR